MNGPFFVVGSQRSGTTMFRLMLNEHPRLHLPPESWFLRDLAAALPPLRPLTPDEVKQALQIVTDHPRWPDWEVSEAAMRAGLADLRSPTLGAFIDAVYRLRMNGKARWGDKTPDYLHDIAKLVRIFPDAQFIHVIRDGRDVCSSLLKKGWWATSPYSAGVYWARQIAAGQEAARLLGSRQYYEIRYENLVVDPSNELRRVCDFLGEQYDASMLRFYERAEENIPARLIKNHRKTTRPPSSEDVSRWKREMTRRDVFEFELAAVSAMRAAGVEPRYRRLASLFSGPVRVVRRIKRWGSGLTRRLSNER